MMVWIQFFGCTAVIVVAGAKLSKYGDIIADKTGLGRTWIGVVLMATVTSLPELITGVSSVTVNDLPDIAAGDVLGSCMFNIAIIAILDFFLGEKPISSTANQAHALSAGFGIALLATVIIALSLGGRMPVLGWFGVSSLLILAVYLVAMRIIYRQEKRTSLPSEEDSSSAAITRSRAFMLYGLNAAAVIAAATWLPTTGERIAEMTGLGQTFVGSLFLAMSTSLPEFVVTYTALRRDAVDLAVANLFGSNLFNLAILAVDDLLYTKGPLLASVNESHLVTCGSAIFMHAIAIVGLTYRPKKKFLRAGLDSHAIVAAFLVATFLLYQLRNG